MQISRTFDLGTGGPKQRNRYYSFLAQTHTYRQWASIDSSFAFTSMDFEVRVVAAPETALSERARASIVSHFCDYLAGIRQAISF